MIEDRKVLLKLNECLEKNQSVALITIIKIEGSTPRGVGSSMLVDKWGNILEGTIGGGPLEQKAKKDAAECIERKRSSIIDYRLDRDSKTGNILPMACGGDLSVFIKTYSSKERLILAGAGHIAEKMAKMANILGYSVTVLDNREERLSPELFPGSHNLILGDIAENIGKLDIDDNTFIVIVTHGHKYDQDVLEKVAESNAKYIGMIGSNRKVKINFDNLLKKGISKENLAKVYAPIGLDLGGESPEEIALSIMAEMQSMKFGKDAHHLCKNRFEF